MALLRHLTSFPSLLHTANHRRFAIVLLLSAAACGGSTAAVSGDGGVSSPIADSGARDATNDGASNSPDSSTHEDGATNVPPPASDAGADVTAPSHDCVASGGECISGSQCAGGAPSVPATCGNTNEVCCAPPYDAGQPQTDDASLGVSCTDAGGSCHSTGGICAHGTLPTSSCGDPSMWMCCAP